uniref:Uncharacterized protein n=1 Tax=Romanomermis culicivorax TaxID=13658 RepID=A0A915JZB1_ROMCU
MLLRTLRERPSKHIRTCATVRRLSMVRVAHSTWYLRASHAKQQNDEGTIKSAETHYNT